MDGRGKFEFNVICHYCGGSEITAVAVPYGLIKISCAFCESIGPNGWLIVHEVRPGFLSSELHAAMDEEVSSEEED